MMWISKTILMKKCKLYDRLIMNDYPDKKILSR